ncbi:MAG: transporter substrate-binding domain-containing protein [Burkholderiales bacterium]|nr:transporter substrate-binding domain-containing protein [Burkholderiales bacterium]
MVGLLLIPAATYAADAPKIVLRTASQQATPARYNAADRDMPGLCVEILHAIEQIDPGIAFTGLDEEAPLQRVLAEVEKHRLDFFACAARTPEREAQLTYLAQQVYSSHDVLAVRARDTVDVHALADIPKLGTGDFVIVARGTMLEDMANKVPGLNVDAGSADKLVNLRKLLTGRARFYFETELNLNRAIQDAHAEKEVRILPTPLADEPQYVVVNKHLDTAVVARLNAALKTLEGTGALQRIYARYALLER